MEASAGFGIFFGKAKIDNIYNSFLFMTTDYKIVCFDISMEEAFLLNGFKTVYDLNSDVENGWDTKFFFAISRCRY